VLGHDATDVAGGAAADVEHGSRHARPREAAQALDVPGLAGELVGEVGGVLLGDAVERLPDRIRAQATVGRGTYVPTRSVAPRSRSSAIVER
jgi:hypothetical protein